MENLRLATVGAVCAILTTLLFVVGIAFVVSSGVQVLIPETGDGQGVEWINDVQESGDLFFVGAWLALFGGFTALVAFVGFYDALRGAGPAMVLAPILGAVGMTLVTVSHAIPVAIAYELVPAYADASGATRESLEVTTHTLASVCLVTNYLGNALGWGVVVPLYAYAILKTGVVSRWIGWLGFVPAVFAGWLGLLAPAWSVIEGLTVIGFLGFFVFMAVLGVALLRSPSGSAAPQRPAVPA